MPISLDEVRHVARLARLDLDEAEILSLQSELNALLGHFGDLELVDPSDMEAVAMRNVWAEDIARASLPRWDALRNAPTSKAGLFVVPTIIED